MRVLHVNKYLYRRGGAEAYLQDVAAVQAAAGAEVAFWGMDHPDNDPALADRFAGRHAPFVELEPPPPGVAAKVRAGARMVWSPASGRALAGVVADYRPDVAHLHNVYHQLSPSVLQPLRAAGVPTVLTLHDYKLACPSYQFLVSDQGAGGGGLCTRCLDGRFRHAVQTRCKGGSRGASAVLAAETRIHRSLHAWSPVHRFVSPSRFLADTMTRAGVYPDRIRICPNFVDAAALPTPADARPGRPVVLAGRLSAEKGVDVLVRALALLPEARLEVAGDGPEAPRLRALAQRLAPGRVVFHGRLERSALHRLLAGAAVAVVPSRWYENMPMAVLEAFGCGVPVVASDLGGLPELLDHGVDGLVVPAEDPAALAAALGGLLADPHRAAAMGAAGRRKVLTRYSPAGHLDRLTAVYREAAVAAGRPAAVPA